MYRIMTGGILCNNKRRVTVFTLRSLAALREIFSFISRGAFRL
jgi:hypothetical protein